MDKNESFWESYIKVTLNQKKEVKFQVILKIGMEVIIKIQKFKK
jgi:hypothetical protein